MTQDNRVKITNVGWDKKDHRYWDGLPSQIPSDLEMYVLDIVRADICNILSYDAVLVDDD